MAKTCDCSHPVTPGSPLDVVTRGIARKLAGYCREQGCSQSEAINRLTRSTSKAVAARVPNAQHARILRVASQLGVTPGEFVRRVLLASSAGADPASVLAKITADLGLPDGASPDDVLAAVQGLLAALAPSSPASPPTANKRPLGWSLAPSRRPAAGPKLSQHEVAACHKAGLTPAEFVTRKRTLVRRV